MAGQAGHARHPGNLRPRQAPRLSEDHKAKGYSLSDGLAREKEPGALVNKFPSFATFTRKMPISRKWSLCQLFKKLFLFFDQCRFARAVAIGLWLAEGTAN
jgi:hypothetical protein